MLQLVMDKHAKLFPLQMMAPTPNGQVVPQMKLGKQMVSKVERQAAATSVRTTLLVLAPLQ